MQAFVESEKARLDELSFTIKKGGAWPCLLRKYEPGLSSEAMRALVSAHKRVEHALAVRERRTKERNDSDCNFTLDVVVFLCALFTFLSLVQCVEIKS